MHSATTGLSLGAGRHSRSHMRKKKTRVVNLRKPKTTDDISESGDSETSSVFAASEPIISTQIPEEPEDNIITPPTSPEQRVRFRTTSIDLGDSPRKLHLPTTPRRTSRAVPENDLDVTPRASIAPSAPIFSREHRPSFVSYSPEKAPAPAPVTYQPAPFMSDRSSNGSILEQAWVLKMAGELARRTHDEKVSSGFWAQQDRERDEREDTPPPAYVAKA